MLFWCCVSDDATCSDGDPGLGSSKTDATQVASPITSARSQSLKVKPYDHAHVVDLFKAYADPDDPDAIGPEGLEKLCEEAEIPMDGALPLILAWLLDAKEMAKFTRVEWLKAMDDLRIDSLSALSKALIDLQELLILPRKPSPKRPMSSASRRPAIDLYNKCRYNAFALDPKDTFSKLYVYCFKLAKPESARSIDMETAAAFWSVLLVPKYAIMSEIIHYIGETGTYKGVNKDLWTMMHEFCQTVKPSLEGYDSDGAWPTLLDNFVAWKKSTTCDRDTPMLT